MLATLKPNLNKKIRTTSQSVAISLSKHEIREKDLERDPLYHINFHVAISTRRKKCWNITTAPVAARL